jgi:uncharacterized protein (UPF0248 family)
MTREEFKEKFIIDVKIKINNREECYKFQEIAFEFGAKVHSTMHKTKDEQIPIAYNITDIYQEYKGRSFATDMTNLVIYDNGTRIQQSGFFHLENDKKLIHFDEMIEAYGNLTD